MKKININYNFLFLLLLIGCAIFFSNLIPSTQATQGDKVTGWGWSDTIGWISFNNCITETNCPGINYGVTYNQQASTDYANLTGWAWSDNIGWIKFGGLDNFPTGPGTDSNDARLYTSGTNSGMLSGWARACAGTISENCSSMASRADGWDGWISLKGLSTNGESYGIKFNLNTGNTLGGHLHNFAWGSEVIGWIDFSRVKIKGLNNPVTSIYDFNVQPRCVTSDLTPITISWDTVGMSECDIYKNNLNWSDNVTLPFGSKPTTIGATSSFYLKCLDTNTPTNVFNSSEIQVKKQNVCDSDPTGGKIPTYIER